MDTNFKISNILYNMKHIGDLYYDLSSKAAKECNLTKPEADILLFIKNNPEFNTAKDIVKLRGFSKAEYINHHTTWKWLWISHPKIGNWSLCMNFSTEVSL